MERPTKNTLFFEEERWYLFKRLLDAKIEVYPFVYDPNPDTLLDFMNEGERRFGPGFLLKTWIFRLKVYEPTAVRIKALGKSPDQYQEELDENFKKSEAIMQKLIYKRFRLNYKAVSRSGIPLKTNKPIKF